MQKYLFACIFLLFTAFSFAQVQTGKASFYADKFEGRRTASGVKYHHNKATAAHRHLPFGTKVRVTNLANNKTTVVEINDRGPFVSGRIIDLSKSSAKKLGYLGMGVTDVAIEVIGGDSDAIADVSTPADIDNGEPTTSNVSTNPEPNANPDASVAQVEPLEFYELNINRVEPDWFGIQIGSFQELTNLIRLADNLKGSYQKDVIVQVKVIQDIKVYTLVVGKFKTRDKAEKFKTEVSKRYPESFIVDFSKF
ncbi:septal ring lytic transglycosylase RlpA family protein [Mesonia sp. MT50]|uniref:Probable endolytic peptidoglycan transglycosylase RlpA n=1 Tax=Mesonia profundi TaxID=3070998 RepID=A0ABU1A6B8_9FLAO|nr:septal ring lytic transglycosylase RlpA family protein [Mesonia profundi]MDQ7918624.1 septal ring lytic transglycosylase RlpA family protein [Mesonia profundi]